MHEDFCIYHDDLANIYLFITLASQRAHQLLSGASPRVEAAEREKPTIIAMREALQGLLKYTQEYEMERPDVKFQSMNISFM